MVNHLGRVGVRPAVARFQSVGGLATLAGWYGFVLVLHLHT